MYPGACANDYSMLTSIYSHVDSVNTFTLNLPEVMGEIDFAGPGQWGKAVESEGRTTVHALDFGGGNMVFTFVISADEQHKVTPEKIEDLQQ